MNKLERRVSVAPMMDHTDRHCRYFLRLISKHVLLYTEMITTGALLHGDRERYLAYHHAEHPLALQLGGSDPSALALAAHLAEERGFDEVNLNCGCPSDRVQEGRFGACLMAEPTHVARCVDAMRGATRLPVTVKTRLGIDERDSYDDLREFIQTVADAGCATFILHARKAWLSGLSPKENREIPPLRYEVVYQVKRDFPNIEIVLNGGIVSLDAAEAQLAHVDGVMIGRAAYHNPYLLAEVDRRFFGEPCRPETRAEILGRLEPYIKAELQRGSSLQHMSRPILGLFQGCPGARQWRRYISQNAYKSGAGYEVLAAAARAVGLSVGTRGDTLAVAQSDSAQASW
jgi:tRNA-dihydrouridine synthase A